MKQDAAMNQKTLDQNMPETAQTPACAGKPTARRAQGLVEFALIMPILLLLIMGIVDFGWMVFNYNSLYNGLREGLRYGSVSGFDDNNPQYEQCNEIRARIRDLANTAGITVDNQGSLISVWYDDGRPANDTWSTDASTTVIAYCDTGATASPLPYYSNAAYDIVNNDVAVADSVEDPRFSKRTAANPIQGGDRIVIEVDMQVRFLTPFLRAFAPNGLRMNVQAARTIITGLKVS
jgi:hypothetical protein